MPLKIFGHRGARGLYPENTLEGFKRALKYPLNGFELDIVVTNDHQVVVSHEPWMRSLICTDPHQQPISENDEKTYNIYQMNYSEIQKFDCGSKTNIKFPEQELFKTCKPLLKEVFSLLAKLTNEDFTLLLEIKSAPSWYGVYQPPLKSYVNLIVDFLNKNRFRGNLILQSFDPAILNLFNKTHPPFNFSLIIENNMSVAENLSLLQFTPCCFTMRHDLINTNVFNTLKEKGIEIVAWNVNTQKEALRLEKIGITNIITDFPNLFLSTLSNIGKFL